MTDLRTAAQMALTLVDDLETDKIITEQEAETLRARLAEHEKEQEPVAWTIAGKITNWSQDFSSFKTKTYTRPVYAAPPKREWVGLTDEEIVERANADYSPKDFARGVAWAELKLKEKNT